MKRKFGFLALVSACLVACRSNHAMPFGGTPYDYWPSRILRVIEHLDSDEEGIHIDVQDHTHGAYPP